MRSTFVGRKTVPGDTVYFHMESIARCSAIGDEGFVARLVGNLFSSGGIRMVCGYKCVRHFQRIIRPRCWVSFQEVFRERERTLIWLRNVKSKSTRECCVDEKQEIQSYGYDWMLVLEYLEDWRDFLRVIGLRKCCYIIFVLIERRFFLVFDEILGKWFNVGVILLIRRCYDIDRTLL